MEILQTLSGMINWPAIILMIVFMMTSSFYVNRTNKKQADEIAKKADTEAIEALQRQVSILQGRIVYLESALKEAGIHVRLDGKIEHVSKNEQGDHRQLL